MDVNGGQARRVLTCDGALRVPWWAPNQTGIYHLDPARGIVFHDGATHSVKTIVPLEPYSFVNGLAVSPDQRWLLYGKRDRAGSDIMIVENFN